MHNLMTYLFLKGQFWNRIMNDAFNWLILEITNILLNGAGRVYLLLFDGDIQHIIDRNKECIIVL